MSEYTGTEFVCTDVLGLEIKCATEQWQYLIKHEEMIGQQGVIKAILMSPDFINQSAKKNCHTYYKRLVLAKIGSTRAPIGVPKKSLWTDGSFGGSWRSMLTCMV
jgi:ssRNA-specific RNase YbeY (16S rRNA maturation enzyme)